MAKGRYHHGDLRAALLDAAEELVRERGADGWSLREASARVGVSPSAAYHHFASRDALVRALSERILSRLGNRLADACKRAAEVTADPDARERAAEQAADPDACKRPADPSGADPSGADPSGADPSGADPSGADPSGADPSGVGPGGVGPGGVGPGGVGPGGVGPGGADSRGAGRSGVGEGGVGSRAPVGGAFDLQRRLIALGRDYLHWAVEDPAVARLVFGAGATGPDSRVSPHPHDVLTAELDRLADLGALPAASRPGAEFVVWAPIHGLAVLLIDGLIRVDDARAFDRQAERVIRATLNGLCQEPAPSEGWPAVHTAHTDRRRSHLGQEGEQVGPGAGDLLRQAE
ncbi:TetR/AcrR family transcriptional regulator [Nonomuraea jabiensis]|uniref:TetR/AcrR family transcriptional regulator n=1 Tax=Nonomuraea jabiensis TaxID=882448 RepID=UPI003D709110